MKIKIWSRTTSEDSECYTSLFTSEEEARDGLDEDGYYNGDRTVMPHDVSSHTLEFSKDKILK